MTTISMNAMNLAYGNSNDHGFTFPRLNPAFVERVSEVADVVFDRAMEFTGGIVLAAIPFSLLAWMFIAY